MKAQIVSLHCVLKNRLGRVLSSSYCQDVLTSSPGAGHLKGLGAALNNLKKGETRKVSLNAPDAYGFYDPKLVITCPREELPRGKGARLGQSFEVRDDAGDVRTYRIAEIRGGDVILDANHPLAGQDLIFEIKALSARDATEDEVQSAVAETEFTQFETRRSGYTN